MPYNIDPNRMKQTIDNMFGQGAYENRMSTINNIAKLSAQKDMLQSQYDQMQKAQKAAQTASQKKSYQDAVNYWSNPQNKASLQNGGAYKVAEDVRNDPNKQAAIKAQGYNVSDYINALYNAASDGKFRSEREFNQYNSNLKKAVKSNSSTPNFMSHTQDEQNNIANAATGTKKATMAHAKQTPKSSGWRGLLQTIEKDAGKPLHAITGGINDLLNQEKGHIQQAQKTGKSSGGIGINLGELGNAVKQGWSGQNNVSGADLTKTAGLNKLIGNKASDLVGGGVGFALNPLNSIALSGLGKAADLTALGNGTLGANILKGSALMGGLTAGENAYQKLADPNSMTTAQMLESAGANALMGGLGEGLSGIIGKLRSGEKLTPQEEQQVLALPEPQKRLMPPGLPEPQAALPEPQKALPEPMNGNLALGDSTAKSNAMKNVNDSKGALNDLQNMYQQQHDQYVNQGLKQAEENFVNKKLEPVYQADTSLRSKKALADEYQKIKSEFPKGIEVPDSNKNDFNLPKAFKGKGSSTDIYAAADQLGKTPDELVNYLNSIDKAHKLVNRTSKKSILGYSSLKQAENAIRKEFNAQHKNNALQGLKQEFLQSPEAQSMKMSQDHITKGINDLQNASYPESGVMRVPLKYVGNIKNPIATRVQKVFKDVQNVGEKPKTANENFKKTVESLKSTPKQEQKGLKLRLDLQYFAKLERLMNQKAQELGYKNAKEFRQKAPAVATKYEKGFIKRIKSEQAPTSQKKSAEKVVNSSPKVEKTAPKQTKVKSVQPEKVPVQTNKEEIKNTVQKLISNSDNWKDKSALAYGRETMDRNFTDIMGKDAPKMKSYFLDPIKKNEADRIRFINAEKDRVKGYEIKPRSKEDKLVQMYGEKKINLDELKQRTDDWHKVVKVANDYRNKYDEVLTKVNKVLVENGFKPIPKREDYFPHYEEIDSLMKSLGFDMQDNSLPTDINGLTDQFRPGKNFFSHALKRKSDQTTYGAIEGFDKYIEGVSNLIYHTKDIKKLRSLEDVLRSKYEGKMNLNNFVAQLREYTDLLSGKKSKLDRGAELYFGRKVYNALDTIRKRTGANMIGGNVSSALTNFIPLTQAMATTNKGAFIKAMYDTMANVLKRDGFTDKSDFLTRRIGTDPLYRNLWNKATDKSMWLMKTLDKFASQVIVRSKYYEGLQKGLSEKEAMKKANDWAAKIMADRSKGSIPNLFSSKTLGILSQFQLEVNNQLSFVLKDMPKEYKSKAALASAYAQLIIYSYAINELYKKLTGNKPALDPLGTALQAYKDYTNPSLTAGKATANTVKNIAGQLPFTSLATGGRFPISAGIPSIPSLINQQSTLGAELTKPLWYLAAPAGGSQTKKTLQGLTDLNLNPFKKQGMSGDYSGNKLRYPIKQTPMNVARGAVFGKYAFPEADQYYANGRKQLSDNQTKQVENSNDPQTAYDNIMTNRRFTTLNNEYKKVVSNPSLSDLQKKKKINEIMKRMNDLKKGG